MSYKNHIDILFTSHILFKDVSVSSTSHIFSHQKYKIIFLLVFGIYPKYFYIMPLSSGLQEKEMSKSLGAYTI